MSRRRRCEVVDVDGTRVWVQSDGPMTETAAAALGDVVRALEAMIEDERLNDPEAYAARVARQEAARERIRALNERLRDD